MTDTDIKLEDLTETSAPADFEAVLGNQDNLKKLMAENKFGTFVKDYASSKAKANTDVQVQVKEQVEASIAEWLKDSGAQTKRLNLDTEEGAKNLLSKKGTLYNQKAPGASIDNNGVKDSKVPSEWGDFMQGIWHHANTLANSDDLFAMQSEIKKVQNSFGSVVPADGGFLIPEILRSDLLQLAMEQSVVRSRAQVIPMSSLAVPIPSVDETSRVSSVFGGIVAFWTEEGAAATESQASFGRVRLEAKKLTVYSEAPNELIADAPAFGGFLNANLPRATGFFEDDAFINGSGVGEPLGVLNGAGVVSPTRAVANEVSFTDVVNIFTRLLPGSYPTAVWICSPAVVAQLLQLALTVATGDSISPPLWLTGGQAIDGAPLKLLGRPLIVSEKVPDLGTTGDLSLIDFSHYLIGDRQMMQATSSPHFKFSSDVTAFKVVERVDGRPWVNTPLTPKNGGSTLSPYITLDADVTA